MVKEGIKSHKKAVPFFLLVFIFTFFSNGVMARQILNHRENKKIKWKLFFNKVFALEIKKEKSHENDPFFNTLSLLKQHTSWSPLRLSK